MNYIYSKFGFVNRGAYRWIVFVLLFMVYSYDYIQNHYGFSYTDEIIMMGLVSYWMVKARHKSKGLKIVFFVFGIYLLNSLLFPHNVTAAIFSDFIQQLKPFVAFYCILDLGIFLNGMWRKKIRRLCIVLILLMLPIGLTNIGGYCIE